MCRKKIFCDSFLEETFFVILFVGTIRIHKKIEFFFREQKNRVFFFDTKKRVNMTYKISLASIISVAIFQIIIT